MIKSIRHDEYTTSGDNVQWTVKTDDVEKIIRLIFEESADKNDWKNNFNIPVEIYKNQESCLLVAKGWGNAYKSCNDEVMEGLLCVIDLHPDYDVHICGWSYGGALSLLAAEDYFYRTGRKASVFTYGAPKPLWGKKTQKYVRSCIHVIKQWEHVNDCVGLMPPLPGYKRVVTDKVGNNFCIIKLFQPNKYHTIYGDPTLYEGK
jgi:hypothetical protein